MRSLPFVFILLFLFNAGFAQLNMNLVNHVDYQSLHNTGCSNLWGYTDELGNEYAIVGLNNGTSIVDITDPSNPVEIYYLPDSVSTWREVKVWQDYAYVTSEAEVGLLIIDLSPLPASTSLTDSRFYGPSTDPWASAHSLFIDENGILYIHGANRGNGGVIFYDLTQDPVNPPEVGQYDAYYVHDSYARGDTLFPAHITDGFYSVIDVSDKANPAVLATQTTPSVFTHNTWLSDDGNYLFTTDEVSNAYVASYDITDLSNITELDKVQSNPGSGSIPHNTYVLDGNYIITSWYRDGVLIHDVLDPSNMIEVGNYDLSPLTGNGFNSIWGVYAYFPSGNIILSDIENGLYILTANYVRGCYVHGTVTDAVTTGTVNNVLVEMVNQNITATTDLVGNYRTGTGLAGTYDFIFSKPGYESDTVYNVSLTNGDTVFVNAQLNPIPPVSISGAITENGTGNAIDNATIEFVNSDFTFTAATDGSGNYMISTAYPGTYAVTVGHWGHRNFCDSVVITTAPVNVYSASLPEGYYDDFYFDFGWSINAGAAAGNWVRDVPAPTGLPGGIPVNPWNDVTDDCGEKVYVTGNISGSVGADDVDGGPTILTSPVFDATLYSDAWVGFYYWFYNGGGSGTPNDVMNFSITDGATTVPVFSFNVNNTPLSQWIDTSFRIADFITPNGTMQIIVSVEDIPFGHLVEGGIDRFYVSEGNQVSVEENSIADGRWSIYPNPAEEFITINLHQYPAGQIQIMDITGKQLFSRKVSADQERISLDDFSPGLYLVIITSPGGNKSVKKLIVQ